jgi:hypothetical protein
VIINHFLIMILLQYHMAEIYLPSEGRFEGKTAADSFELIGDRYADLVRFSKEYTSKSHIQYFGVPEHYSTMRNEGRLVNTLTYVEKDALPKAPKFAETIYKIHSVFSVVWPEVHKMELDDENLGLAVKKARDDMNICIEKYQALVALTTNNNTKPANYKDIPPESLTPLLEDAKAICAALEASEFNSPEAKIPVRIGGEKGHVEQINNLNNVGLYLFAFLTQKAHGAVLDQNILPEPIMDFLQNITAITNTVAVNGRGKIGNHPILAPHYEAACKACNKHILSHVEKGIHPLQVARLLCLCDKKDDRINRGTTFFLNMTGSSAYPEKLENMEEYAVIAEGLEKKIKDKIGRKGMQKFATLLNGEISVDEKAMKGLFKDIYFSDETLTALTCGAELMRTFLHEHNIKPQNPSDNWQESTRRAIRNLPLGLG